MLHWIKNTWGSLKMLQLPQHYSVQRSTCISCGKINLETEIQKSCSNANIYMYAHICKHISSSCTSRDVHNSKYQASSRRLLLHTRVTVAGVAAFCCFRCLQCVQPRHQHSVIAASCRLPIEISSHWLLRPLAGLRGQVVWLWLPHRHIYTLTATHRRLNTPQTASSLLPRPTPSAAFLLFTS